MLNIALQLQQIDVKTNKSKKKKKKVSQISFTLCFHQCHVSSKLTYLLQIDGKYEFRYLFVSVEDYPPRTIIIEDNRSSMTSLSLNAMPATPLDA